MPDEVDVGAYRAPMVPQSVQGLAIPTTNLSQPDFPSTILSPGVALPETASVCDMPAAPQEIAAIYDHKLTSPQFPSCQIDVIAAIPEFTQYLPEPEFGDEPAEFLVVEEFKVSVAKP